VTLFEPWEFFFFFNYSFFSSRSWHQLSPFKLNGMCLRNFFLRLCLLPAFYFLLWIFYYEGFNFDDYNELNVYQRTYVTRNGLVFNCLAGAYFMSIITTVCTMAHERTRYYQESREGIYTGPLYLISQLIQSIPISLLSTLFGSLVIFRGLKTQMICKSDGDTVDNHHESCEPYSTIGEKKLASMVNQNIPHWFEYNWENDFVVYWLTLWACYLLAEQQTSSLLIVVKSSYTAALSSIYITIIYLVLGSGCVRSFGSLPEILYHLTYITQSRYTGALLNQIEFHNKTSLVELKWINETGFEFECDPAKRSESFGTGFGCRYV